MTKLYVYDYVDPITSSWHSGGGVVIVTDNDPQDAWDNFRNGQPDIIEKLPEPDRQYELAAGESERVDLFPDAGCC